MFLICLKPQYQVYAVLKTCPLKIAKFKTDEDVSSMKSIFEHVSNLFRARILETDLKDICKCF